MLCVLPTVAVLHRWQACESLGSRGHRFNSVPRDYFRRSANQAGLVGQSN